MELPIIIAILKQSRTLNRVGWGIFAITAITVGVIAPLTFILASLLIAFVLLMIQSYFALRLSLDDELFRVLQAEKTTQENLQQFDQILHQLKLIKTTPNERSLDDRIQGTMVLIKSQVIYLVLQAIFYIAIILILFIFQR